MKNVIVTGFMLLGMWMGTQPASAYRMTSSSQCSTIDLRKEFSWKMRNQGDISWCYAHAASDYLQYYFKVPEQISAADIAIQYNLRPWPRLLRWLQGKPVAQTGFIRSAMWDAIDAGYCPESVFPSESWVKHDSEGTHSVGLKKAIAELASLQEQVKLGLYLSANDLPFSYEFKNVPKEVLFDLLANTSAKNFLNELRLTTCQNDRKSYSGSVNAIGMRMKGRNTFNRINRLFEANTPVTIDFFYGVLNHLDQYKHSLMELHTTLLVGRRFNESTGQCQYLIKNSYGTNCTEYDPRLTCEAGYVWMDESDLYGAMTSYVYFKDVLFDDSGPDLTPQNQQQQD